MNTESINQDLSKHQAGLGVEGWRFSSLCEDLHSWAERMIVEFKLDIGPPALSIERLRGAYGHYRHGRNGFGLNDEIAINVAHVRAGPYWQVLGTLLHELLHSWQEHHGQPGKRHYHNKAFRERAASLGLIIDARGYQEYGPPESPFLSLLNKYGVTVPEIPVPKQRLSERRGSKLKLYECPCGVKVRVGRSRFHARCLDCNGEFCLQAGTAG